MDEKPKRRRGRPTKAEAEQMKREREEAEKARIRQLEKDAKLYQRKAELLENQLEEKKRGPAPMYTPEKLYEAFRRYIVENIAEGNYPDEGAMRVALGLSKRTWQSYAANPDYEEAFDYAMDCRQSWLERTMVSQPKLAQGCMNALKQKQNGGFIDRQDNGAVGGSTLKIVFQEASDGNVKMSKEDFD